MSRLDDFRYATPIRKLNKFVQLLLALCLFVGINTLASRYYWREDISGRSVFALSPETLAYLGALKEHVDVIVTIPSSDASGEEQQKLLRRYVKNLLEEYREAARRDGEEMLSVEYVDPYRNPRRAEELARNLHIDQSNVVIFSCGRRQRVITPSEIMDFSDLEPVAFKGEQAFTSALLETASGITPVVYFTTGHGEMSIADVTPNRGLSVAAQQLRARNLEPRLLDLSGQDVPEDAALVVVVDPQGQFLPQETVRLRRYLEERSGRLVVLLGARRQSGLERFLMRWGISVDDMIVHESGPESLDSGGALLVRSFADSPVTSILRRNNAPIVAGQARPILAGQMAAEPGTRLTVLMASSAKSWAEIGWRSEPEPVFTAGKDLPGPIPLAVLAQTGARSGAGIYLPGSRVIAVGLGDIISNNYISSFGNQAFFFSMLNWMLDREQVISIDPTPIEKYQLSLSRKELGRLALLLCLPAAAAAILGLLSALIRRY